MEEPVPGESITSTLPINNGMSVSWTPDLWHMQAVLLVLLEGGGVPMAELPMEEEDKEEEQRERPPMAGKVGPHRCPSWQRLGLRRPYC